MVEDAHMEEVGTDNSNSSRRSKQRLRGGHSLVDLIVLFVGEKTLVARKRERGMCCERKRKEGREGELWA